MAGSNQGESREAERMESGQGHMAREVLHGERNKKDEQVQLLQTQLSKEKDARKEERFVALLALVILIDIYFFTLMPTLGGPIAILILQLLLLLPVARMMGVDEIAETLDKALFRVIRGKDDAD